MMKTRFGNVLFFIFNKNEERLPITFIIIPIFLSCFLCFTGCQSHFYSPMENNVYDYINEMSKSIPPELYKTGDGYYESSTKVGKFVNNKPLRIGYLDPQDYERIMSNSSQTEGYQLQKSISFTRIYPAEGYFLVDAQEVITLSEGADSVIYIKKDNVWYRGLCKSDFAGSSAKWEKCYNDIFEINEKTKSEIVQRYIDLAQRIDRIYFED